jgi:hypothetical protein
MNKRLYGTERKGCIVLDVGYLAYRINKRVINKSQLKISRGR